MKSTKKRLLNLMLGLTAICTVFGLTACDSPTDQVYSEGLEYTLLVDENGYSVTGIGTCQDKKLVIPATYNNLPVTAIGDYAFYYCDNLTSVSIGNSVTTIGDAAFGDCTNLTSVVIPDSVTTIGDAAFGDCTNLTSVVIPDGVTTIGDSAFAWCTSLTSVIIPDSVTTIGSRAFAWCTSLQDIQFTGTVEEWNAILKGSNWNYTESSVTKVVCLDGEVAI